MLDKCVRDQWSIDDLDWERPPPELPRDKEEAVCQYFTDMAGIERLAKALFATQAAKEQDPTLRAILQTFVVDEERHAVAGERLARYYDVHRWRPYELTEALVKFRPHFLRVVALMPPEIACAYITAGELLLDVALLRSLDDYVGDQMSHQAMHLINRDESRHIAIDFHMTEVYASDEFLAARATRPGRPWRLKAAGARALATMMWHAQPFLKGVFLDPMDKTDPSGKRLLEAFKRMQLLSRKDELVRRPFTKFMLALQDLINHPVLGKIVGAALMRVMGGERRAATILFTQDELARTRAMTFEQLAEEATAAKYSRSA